MSRGQLRITIKALNRFADLFSAPCMLYLQYACLITSAQLESFETYAKKAGVFGRILVKNGPVPR
jgi:hypothetical protein